MDGAKAPGKVSLVKEVGVVCRFSCVGSRFVAGSWLKPWERRRSRLDTKWLMALLCCAFESYLLTFCSLFNPDSFW